MKRRMVLSIFASLLATSSALAANNPDLPNSTSEASMQLPAPSNNAGSLSTNIGFLSYLYNDNTNPSQMAGMQMFIFSGSTASMIN